MIITPQDTISRLSRLSLTDNQFSTVHHFEDLTTVKSHVKYLEGLARGYQISGNNYVVALRLDAIESMRKEGVSLNKAIKKATSKFPFSGE